MQRIAHVIGSVSKGGVENLVFNYYRAIDKTQFQFDFIIDKDSPCDIPYDILSFGCKVYKIPSYKHIFSYIKELKNIFINYRIVHSHMNALSVFSLYAAKRAKVPVRIAHSHNTSGKGEYLRNIIKYVLRKFSKVYPTHLMACSNHAGLWLFGNKSIKNGKVTVIRNAIDVSNLSYNSTTRSKIRSELNIDNNIVIGHVGRFMRQKNHSFILNIFKEIVNINKEAVLILIGDGELKEKMIKKAANLGLENRILFLGLRDDVFDIYQAMDVFVFPSLYEGLGLAAVEAQCSGLPCVLSNEVPAEAVTGKLSVFLSLNDSPKKWAGTILNKTSNYDRGQESDLCCSRWNINTEVQKLNDFYKSC